MDNPNLRFANHQELSRRDWPRTDSKLDQNAVAILTKITERLRELGMDASLASQPSRSDAVSIEGWEDECYIYIEAHDAGLKPITADISIQNGVVFVQIFRG